MKKKIAVFGTGYVGLVTAAGLAGTGHSITAVDIDRARVKELKKGNIPFYEPGLKKLVRRLQTAGMIKFTTDAEAAVSGNDAIFVAVGTPSKPDGRVDLSQISRVIDTIIENLDSKKIIVIKSTVPPGTTDLLTGRYSAELESTGTEIVFCPEFLREGAALHDFFHPDRLVIGSKSDSAARTVDEIFFAVAGRFDVPVIKCSPVSAEFIKYASNVMLASRLAVINELAELAETLGGDIRDISIGAGLDKRIGGSFLQAGPGFGGSCFGKDISGIVTTAAYHGINISLVREILASNDSQRLRPALKLEKALGSLRGRKVALLGLAFKADTDDVRGSAAFDIAAYLLDRGASLKAHDPAAEYNFIKDFKRKGYSCTDTAEAALLNSDAVIILTEWREYRELSPEFLAEKMKGRVVVDARNIMNENSFRNAGFTLIGTGRPADKPRIRIRSRNDFINAAVVSV